MNSSILHMLNQDKGTYINIQEDIEKDMKENRKKKKKNMEKDMFETSLKERYEIQYVVYNNQQMDALHNAHWSESCFLIFSHLFLKNQEKNSKKALKCLDKIHKKGSTSIQVLLLYAS